MQSKSSRDFRGSVNAFHEKAGRCQEHFPSALTLPERTASAAILPSALLLSDVRSVPVGRSRFSRCCYLIIDLSPNLKNGELGQAFIAVTGTRRS
jgi:hypothetical protein